MFKGESKTVFHESIHDATSDDSQYDPLDPMRCFLHWTNIHFHCGCRFLFKKSHKLNPNKPETSVNMETRHFWGIIVPLLSKAVE